MIGLKPKTGVFIDSSGLPNVFQNAQSIRCSAPTRLQAEWFNSATPTRAKPASATISAGPAFSLDSGLSKTWNITEARLVRFSWEVFNVTNSVRFDAANSLAGEDLVDITGFGKFQRTLTTPRVMQFSLRVAF